MSRNTAIAITLFVLALLAPMTHANDTGVSISSELQPFFRDYLSATKAEAAPLRLPAVWVYSPAGDLVARFEAESDIQRLGDLLKQSDAVSISSLNLDTLSLIAAKVGAPIPAAERGQWTAILLSSDGCNTACSGFRSRLHESQTKRPALIRVVDFTLRR